MNTLIRSFVTALSVVGLSFWLTSCQQDSHANETPEEHAAHAHHDHDHDHDHNH